MIRKIIYLLICVGFFFIGYYFRSFYEMVDLNPFVAKVNEPLYELKQYSFPALKKAKFAPLTLRIGKTIQETDSFNSYLFFLEDEDRKVSGLLNVPNGSGTYPLAILLRGYVDKEIYTTGVGSQRVGEVLASNGYITLAPDFLGYGHSTNAPADSLKERFLTYTTVLELIRSLENLDLALINKGLVDTKSDESKVVFWAHSNGGQIALSTLALTGKKYPTVLWAPVSKPFPYSILYYTDEYSDKGKYLRKIIADFEANYDIEKYNPANYYKWIKAPIQIHQGTADDAVPLKWSDELYEKLDAQNLEVDYFIYEGADHNLMPDGWDSAVQKALDFYKIH